jgi:hypothetical protein
MANIRYILSFPLRHYKLIVVLLIVMKFTTLPFTSFPFDFAAYVFQVRQFFDYNIQPLFFWNKGVHLLGIFYLQYSSYTVFIDAFNIAKDNLFLLHTFFKLPFVIFDVLTGLLIYKLINIHYSDQNAAKVSSLIWLSNPLVYWMTEVQGQYAVLASFSIILSLFFLSKHRYILSGSSLAAATAVYYFPVILFPLIGLYIFKTQKRGNIKKYLMGFTATVFILFMPFLFSVSNTESLVGSIAHHSAPDAPITSQSVELPDYSLYKVPYYIFNKEVPNSDNAEQYFSYVNKSSLFAVIIIFIYVSIRIIYVIKRKKLEYNFNDLIVDLIVVISIFMVMIGKFQTHYFLWLLPLIVLSKWSFQRNESKIAILLISFIPLYTTLSSLNLNIYFLDVLNWGTLQFKFMSTPIQSSVISAVVILAVFMIPLLILKSKNHLSSIESLKLLNGVIFTLFMIFYFVMALSITSAYYISINSREQKNTLASSGRIYQFPLVVTEQVEHSNTINYGDNSLSEGSFDNVEKSSLSTIGYISNSPFYLYRINNDPSTAEIVYSEQFKSNALSLKVLNNGQSQINFGPDLNKKLSVDGNEVYSAGFKISIPEYSKLDIEFSVRYRDGKGSVIEGSNKILREISGKTGTYDIKEKFRTAAESSTAELVLTLRDQGSLSTAEVYIDDYNFRKMTVVDNSVTNAVSKESPEKLVKDIIANGEAVNHFKLSTVITSKDGVGIINRYEINGCKPQRVVRVSNYEYSIDHDAKCFQDGKINVISSIENFLVEPEITTSLVQVPTDSYYLKDKTVIIYILGITGILLNIIGVLYMITKMAKLK